MAEDKEFTTDLNLRNVQEAVQRAQEELAKVSAVPPIRQPSVPQPPPVSADLSLASDAVSRASAMVQQSLERSLSRPILSEESFALHVRPVETESLKQELNSLPGKQEETRTAIAKDLAALEVIARKR